MTRVEPLAGLIAGFANSSAAGVGDLATNPGRGGRGLPISVDCVEDEPICASESKHLSVMLACSAIARRHAAADGI